MSITVNTNATALMGQRNLNQTGDKLSQTLSRLSSGMRVINAKDDSAGLAIAQGMDKNIRALKQGSRNANDGISLIQTTQSSMDQILNSLQRMNELASQAKSGTYGSADRANMNKEYQALLSEVGRVANSASFNGKNLLDGSTSTVTIQVGTGNTANDTLSIELASLKAGTLVTAGGVTTSVDGLTITGSAIDTIGTEASGATAGTGATSALTELSAAISTVTSAMAQLGANHANLETAMKGNEDASINLQAARSRIMDTDFAEESSNLSKFQVLQQSGASMLAQANSTAQIALKLLQ